MSLQDQIQQDMKAAMRQRDSLRTNVLRMLKAEIRNVEIERQEELDDEAVLAVLTKAAKQRRESIEAYQEAGRKDLLEVEEAELAIIEAYLPRQLSEVEIRAAVEEAVTELDAKGPGDMGRVMKHLMAQLRGRVDGRVVNEIAREVLTGSSG